MLQRQPTLTWKISLLNDDGNDNNDEIDIDDKNNEQLY